MPLEQNLCGKLGIKLLFSGTIFNIYQITFANPTAYEFLNDLELNIKNKALALFWTIKDNKDILKNPQKSKPLGDGIFELKPTDQARFPYFYDKEASLIITHGFLKKSNKTPIEQIEKAKALRTEFFKRKKENGL